MRAFIAIPFPGKIINQLAKQMETFRSASGSSLKQDSAKWVDPDGIHLTLKFLGEIDAAKTQQVITALIPPGNFQSMTLEVRGFGCFPDCKRPRVFWAGVVAPPALRDLAGRIDAAMTKLGFPSDGRPFSPHLTLARFSGGQPQPWLKSAVREPGEWTSGRFEICEFCLFESQLSPGAPARYHRFASFARPAQKAQPTQQI
ncbi:MAG: RNA 2',3'-cyclic phosphodiesterase [Terriglobia bacterium]